MSYDFEIAPPEYMERHWERNITFNLGPMFKRAGFHPHVLSGMRTKAVMPVVSNAIVVMSDNRGYFETLNPPIDPNTGKRWGDYDGALAFLRELADKLESAPDGYVLKVFG